MNCLYKKYEELLREKNVLSAQVCKTTGLSRSIITNWKQGNRTPSLKSLIKIAEYFGVPITHFLEEK